MSDYHQRYFTYFRKASASVLSVNCKKSIEQNTSLYIYTWERTLLISQPVLFWYLNLFVSKQCFKLKIFAKQQEFFSSDRSKNSHRNKSVQFLLFTVDCLDHVTSQYSSYRNTVIILYCDSNIMIMSYGGTSGYYQPYYLQN